MISLRLGPRVARLVQHRIGAACASLEQHRRVEAIFKLAQRILTNPKQLEEKSYRELKISLGDPRINLQINEEAWDWSHHKGAAGMPYPAGLESGTAGFWRRGRRGRRRLRPPAPEAPRRETDANSLLRCLHYTTQRDGGVAGLFCFCQFFLLAKPILYFRIRS